MEKIKYLVGIHTCRDYWSNVVNYVWKSDWFKYLESRRDVKIIYFWCKEEYGLEKLPHKDIVELPCIESYGQLANKTFSSIRWAYENYDFEYFLKFDDNKKFYEPEKFFEVMERDAADYVITNANPCSYRTFIKWFNKKRIKVSPKYFDPRILYSAWKPYAVSKRFAEIITKNGNKYATMYVKHLGGCEDHMIGKIFSDFNAGNTSPEIGKSPSRLARIYSRQKRKQIKKGDVAKLTLSKLGRYKAKKDHPGLHQPGTVHANNRS